MCDRAGGARILQPGYCSGHAPDAEKAWIENGIKAADEGLTVPLDEVRKMIPKWISKFESQNRR